MATANALSQPLLQGPPDESQLAAVQKRRLWPTAVTQRLQLLIQNQIIAETLDADSRPEAPLVFRLIDALPLLRRLPSRFIGMGIRPEHVSSPEIAQT